ncbi:MAG: helix-turn-helix domain-containing protein [Pseudomonadota bacterium]
MSVMSKKKKPASTYWTPKRIAGLRDKLDLTQTAFAERVGVTRRQVAAWEAGESRPSGPAVVLLNLLRGGKI